MYAADFSPLIKKVRGYNNDFAAGAENCSDNILIKIFYITNYLIDRICTLHETVRWNSLLLPVE